MNVQYQSGALSSQLGFIIDAILAAERVPIGRTMYESVFGISVDELRLFLSETLMQDSIGRPLSLGAFRVLTEGGEPIACCAAWVEPRDGMASGTWTAMALSRHIGMSRFRSRSGAVRTLAEVSPRRSPGILQLESFFVRPEYRGRGLTRRLIDESLRADDTGNVRAEIGLLEENSSAMGAYSAAGFVECWRTRSSTDAFYSLTGSRGFVQLSLTKREGCCAPGAMSSL